MRLCSPPAAALGVRLSSERYVVVERAVHAGMGLALIDADARAVLAILLKADPAERPSARELLAHPLDPRVRILRLDAVQEGVDQHPLQRRVGLQPGALLGRPCDAVDDSAYHLLLEIEKLG